MQHPSPVPLHRASAKEEFDQDAERALTSGGAFGHGQRHESGLASCWTSGPVQSDVMMVRTHRTRQPAELDTSSQPTTMVCVALQVQTKRQQHTLEHAECGQRATERPCEMISRGSRHTGRGAAGEGGGRRLTCACRAGAAPFAAVDGERRPPRGARLGAERQKEGALLNAKRGVGSRRGGHIVVVAPSPKLPEPRRRRPAAGPLRSGPRRTAADERSVELRAGG